MRKMGGLRKKIPITYVTMLIGAVGMAGIPPLTAFFSKDEILAEAFKLGFAWVWLIGLIVAAMTAFYMFRLIGLTFWGEFRGPREVWDKIHESPRVMTIPLILLAIPTVALGLAIGLPFGDSPIKHWLEPVFLEGVELLRLAEEPFALFGIDGVLIIASVAVAASGLAIAWRLFGVEIAGIRLGARPERVRELSARVPFLYRASLNKWWFDELNHLLFIRIGGGIADALFWFDRNVIDGTVNGVGRVTVEAGRGLRHVQTGRVQNYALGIAVGLIVMAGSYLFLVGR